MFYILYDENGQFYGFQDSEEYTQQIINDNTSLDYHEVSDEMHYFLINSQEKFTVNVKLISDDVECLDEEKYFLFEAPKSINIEIVKENLVSSIKNKCQEFITSGLNIELSSGESKLFTFKIEDQINLKNMYEMYSEKDAVLYHASNESFEEYTYLDIKYIYIALLNNKTYNLIYCQVLCKWILDNYTEEMYDNKDIIEYGYTNDYIASEVEKYYEAQKISE